MSDPFANDPFAADETQADAPDSPTSSPWDGKPHAINTNTKEIIAVPETNDLNRVRVTLKAAAGYDAPWITVDGGSIADALAQLEGENAEVAAKLIQKTASVARYFHKEYGGGAPVNVNTNGGQQSAPRTQGKPAGAAQAPNGETKQCDHGEMVFRSGVSKKTGNAWKGFFCPTPKDTPGQCSPEFVR